MDPEDRGISPPLTFWEHDVTSQRLHRDDVLSTWSANLFIRCTRLRQSNDTLRGARCWSTMRRRALMKGCQSSSATYITSHEDTAASFHIPSTVMQSVRGCTLLGASGLVQQTVNNRNASSAAWEAQISRLQMIPMCGQVVLSLRQRKATFIAKAVLEPHRTVLTRKCGLLRPAGTTRNC
jgi:hypothetical protein